jgi:hypothetical protein
MALLLPLVWDEWMMTVQDYTVADDPLPPVQMLGGVPGYALDQFTRIGNTVSRALVKEEPDLRSLLDAVGVFPSQRSQAIGDAAFLIEGGLVRHRAIWPFADMLRLPDRVLPTTGRLGDAVQKLAGYLAARHPQMARARQQCFRSERQ